MHSYMKMPNSNFSVRWVNLILTLSLQPTITLRNGSTIGTQVQNAFQDPAGAFVCHASSNLIQYDYSATSFLWIAAISSINLVIDISQGSSFSVKHRVDVVAPFRVAKSRIDANFTGASGLQIKVKENSSFVETALVTPQYPKSITWPSAGCALNQSIASSLSVSGLLRDCVQYPLLSA
ncbi:GPI-anchored surface protein, putative [Bodo saltans]|uniref:GPI-anchored surface protein, putative n=1 Tax=Bodo saltans TaxID=75058 RepID=A0A0S4JTK7_BODSA|nr:GPI-anchored surface protein, putative [Bodo saltans]|eukprot:CUG93567.1 GPI-anchored surface protein, putative [Bodo saltans]